MAITRIEEHSRIPDAATPVAEVRLVRHIVRSVSAAIPVMTALWMGITAIAVSFTNSGYVAPLAMGAAVGVLAGLFWGTWLGFVLESLDEASEGTDRGPTDR